MSRTINVGDESYSSKGDYKPIPNGTKLRAAVYSIEEVDVKNGDNAGKSQLDITFKITEEGEFKGREIRFEKIPLYDGPAAWKLVSFAESVGWKAGKGEGVVIPDNVREVQGTELIIKVSEKAPDAQKRVFNGVAGYSPLGDGAQSNATTATKPSWGGLSGS